MDENIRGIKTGIEKKPANMILPQYGAGILYPVVITTLVAIAPTCADLVVGLLLPLIVVVYSKIDAGASKEIGPAGKGN